MKTTLPALLRNGYSATAFYQSLDIVIESSNGFDARVVLPADASIKAKGSKTTLYKNNSLVGSFDSSEYKVRFDSVKAIAAPKKQKAVDTIAETTELQKVVRQPKTNIVNVVSLSPVVAALPVVADAPNPEKKQSKPKAAKPDNQQPIPKEAKPKAEKQEKAPRGRQKGYVVEESKRLISNAETQISELINEGTPKFEIAKHLGVSKGTLYRYINDKGIVTPTAVDARRKRDIDLPKEKWITLAMRYKTNVDAIAKSANCSRSTAYARLKEYVPIELWQKPAKGRNNPIPLNCDFWLSIHKKHNGNFETIAIELQCKVSSAQTYFYKSGAGAICKAEKRANKPPKPPRVYTKKVTRQRRVPTVLKDKALWERLAKEYETVKDMAAAIGKGIDTCYAYLNKYVPAHNWKKQKPRAETDKDFWLSMYNKHSEDWQAIGEELKYTVNTVRQYFRESGAAAEIVKIKEAAKQERIKQEQVKRLEFIDQRKVPTYRLEENAKTIIDMMNNGATITAIRKLYNTHYDTVNAFLQRPEIASQIHYVVPKGAASYELQSLHPKEKMLAATSQTKTINKLRDMLSLDKRTIKALMIAYEIPFKDK